jgi:hypothetical protein
MKNSFHKFNIYLALSALLCSAGCGTYQKNKDFAKQEQTTMRLYLEGNRGDEAGTGTVLVTRERFPLVVDRAPFLKEDDLVGVDMINEPGPDGGFFIELHFNEHGALLLDMLTTANRGKHIVVFSQFPHPGAKAPKQKKVKASNLEEQEDLQEKLPAEQPELEKAGEGRTSAWLAAVLIRERDPSGIFRFSPDASRDETARIVRGLKNVIAYDKMLEQKLQ